MSFCKKCGTHLKEYAKFCPQCGEAVRPVFSADQPAPVPEKSGFPLFLVFGIIAAALLITVVFLFRGCGTPAYEKPARITLDVFTGKTDVYKSAQQIIRQFPKPLIDSILQDQDIYTDEQELTKDLAEELESIFEDLSDVKLSYKISSSRKLNSQDLEDLNDAYQNYFYPFTDISEAYAIKITLYSYEDGEENKEKLELNTIKVNGKWYLDYFTFSDLF